MQLLFKARAWSICKPTLKVDIVISLGSKFKARILSLVSKLENPLNKKLIKNKKPLTNCCERIKNLFESQNSFDYCCLLHHRRLLKKFKSSFSLLQAGFVLVKLVKHHLRYAHFLLFEFGSGSFVTMEMRLGLCCRSRCLNLGVDGLRRLFHGVHLSLFMFIGLVRPGFRVLEK